ncbi:lipase family protein [Nocardia sp. NPDC003482]
MTDLSFYAAPPVDEGRRPGEVLRQRRTPIHQLGGSLDSWQILYVSTDTQGELVPASGIVIASDTASGHEPILVYYPPFHGLGGPCAPSQLIPEGEDTGIGPILAALERGWTVAVADGENLGVTGTGPHTFLAARAGGQLLLDLARAAHSLRDLERGLVPVVGWGYADGGRAAAAAAELQPGYAPELDLRGVAAGAVVSDLAEMAEVVNRGRWGVLGLAGLIGLSRAYHHLPLRHVLTDDGHRVATDAEKLSRAVLLAQYPQPLSHWCDRPDPWDDPMWRYVLAHETLAHTTPVVPLHLYHGRDDAIVPVHAGRAVFIDYHRRGSLVTWREFDSDHAQTNTEAVPDTIARLTEDLHERPIPPSTA